MLRQLATIWKFRSFWLSLVRMDLRLRYRRSLLGVGWSLLNPILMTVAFCLVFSSWQKNPNWRSYAPYFLTGLSIFEYIKSCVISGCNTFYRNESYIRQCPLPLTIFSLRTVLGATIHFLISMLVVLLTIMVLQPDGAHHTLGVLWSVVPSIVLLFFFCWAVSVLASFLTVFFHDTQQILEVVFQLLFFLTPIMYQTSDLIDKGLGILVDYNPAVAFFDLIREPLLSGQTPSSEVVFKAMGLTAIFMSLAVGITAWLERKLIFRL